MPNGIEKPFNFVRIGLDQHFDGAIREILDVPDDFVFLCQAFGGHPKPHTLDTPVKHDTSANLRVRIRHVLAILLKFRGRIRFE